jgi:hypothetical protein
MTASLSRTVATRQLTFAFKGSAIQYDFTVCIGEPYLLTQGSVDFDFAEGTAGCVIHFEGLPERAETVIGGDTFQALELALGSAESYLRRLRKKYDFFMEGEPYFED